MRLRNYLAAQFLQWEVPDRPGGYRLWLVKGYPAMHVREYLSPPPSGYKGYYRRWEVWGGLEIIWRSSHPQHPEAANRNLYKSIEGLAASADMFPGPWMKTGVAVGRITDTLQRLR